MNMENAGGEFSTNVPINDNEWHHLTTTYGSGNKKIYVDGVEVSTASQSGTVAASTFKLILGTQTPTQVHPPDLKSMMFDSTVEFLQPLRYLRFTTMDREIMESQNFKLPVLLRSKDLSVKIYLIRF